MPRKSDFPIHVDSSCPTDSTDLQLPSKRNDSDQTVSHNQIANLRSPVEGSEIGGDSSHDEHTEALIHAAARAVVARMEQEAYDQEDSIVSSRTEEGYEAGTEGTELTYGGTELTYGDATELNYDSEADHSNQDLYDGSASSHHEDDVFSQGARSNRSSLNSCTDGEEHWQREQDNKIENGRQSEHIQDCHPPISRIPSTTSNAYSLMPEPLTITSSPTPHTPSKVLSRPAFRTPSSVRAMQMSSPTPSIISGSPRSSKRPTISRLGTPTAHNQSPTKTKTSTRFKAKKEYPLVLLHVTVIPLQWSYGHALDAVSGEGLPRELHSVKESWKLLKDKLADTVLERGILLPHPQDSYETLEERLLEALELPVRPRAKILTCGHYLGPDDGGNSSSEDISEDEDDARMPGAREQWCDICGREVRYEEITMSGRQKRFRIKVYASNGLMRAGAWAAAWKEMERVDVEIEPFVPSHLTSLLESLVTVHAQSPQTQSVNHDNAEHERENDVESERLREVEEAMRRREREEERMREIYGDSPPAPPEFDNAMRPAQNSSSRQKYGDSLPELLWEAVKVVMRDRKQVAICVLSVLVLVLALRPSGASSVVARDRAEEKPAVARTEIVANLVSSVLEPVGVTSDKVAPMPTQVMDAVQAVTEAAVTAVEAEERPAVTPKEEVSDPKVQEILKAENESFKPEIGEAVKESVKEVEQEARVVAEENMLATPEMA
jgi:hypothetical protein